MGAPKKRLVADRFQIEGEAGAGGAGTVYRAQDLESGATVALKVLRGMVDTGAERFLREATTLARVRHRSVVRYVAHGVTGDGEPYLAMEWLEGRDLRRHLGEEGLTLAQTVALGAELADALAAMHAMGVVHRDVKPSNVFLVGPPGRRSEAAKLIDLGLVRIEQVSQSLTRTGVTVGTPGYMAPEQARGERRIGPQADVFSLGCVLFRCLTGQAPFEGTHFVAVLTKVLLGHAPRTRSLRPDIPEALDALVARMLAKDPFARPAGAAEVAAELRAIAAGPLLAPFDEVPMPRSLRLGGLTESEQRIVTVLLAGSTAAAGDEALREIAERFGADLDHADATRTITARQDPSALDQASRLARCALAIAAAFPAAPLAIATGWSLGTGSAVSSELLERGRDLLTARGPGGVVLDEVSAALLDGRFEVVARTEGSLLVGHRDAALAARTLLGRPTACLGREWELSTIASQLADALDESRAVALTFTAPTGVGKSRLAMEAVEVERGRRPDLTVWIARAELAHDGAPLGLLGQIVRAACDLGPGDPPAELGRTIAARVADLVPSPDNERIAAALGEIVGVPPPHATGAGAPGDPRLTADRLRRAWIDFLAAAAARGPVLLVLDDLQWADGPSVRALEAALAELEHAAWMVLALARPEVDERFPRLWAGRNAQRLRLKPLSRKPAERLVRHALGEAAEATVARVVDLAEGNVFFLEEIVRAVAAAQDRGETPPSMVRPREPGAAPAGAGPSAPLPPTVIGVVQARLDGLDAPVRRLLRAASVYGEAFWPGAVAALLGGISTPAEDWPAQLIAAELAAYRPESRFPGQLELAFRNALLREGAYAMLPERDRAAGHLLAGAWLEAHGEPDPLVLARHFEAGGDRPRAAVHALRGAERSFAAADLEGAASLAAHAVELGLPAADRLHALGLRCEAQTWAAAWIDAVATAAEVLALAPPGSGPWARALVARQSHALVTGRFAEVMEIVTTIWRTPPEPEAVGPVLSALTGGTFFLCTGARFATAARLAEHVTGLAQGDPSPAGEARAHVCRCLVEGLGSGDPALALSHGERGCAAYRRAEDPVHLEFAQLFLGVACWQIGDLDRARREMGSLAAESPRPSWGTPPGPRGALTTSVRGLYLGLALVDAGAFDEARAVASAIEHAALARPTGTSSSKEGEARWIHAEIAFRAGDLAAAERETRTAQAHLNGYPLAALALQTLLGAVLLAQGRGADALAAVRAPLAALDEQGGRGFRAARTRLVAARAQDAAGQPAEARETLRLAHASLLSRAAGIEDPALARAFVTAVPENAETLALAEEWLQTSPPRPPSP